MLSNALNSAFTGVYASMLAIPIIGMGRNVAMSNVAGSMLIYTHNELHSWMRRKQLHQGGVVRSKLY